MPVILPDASVAAGITRTAYRRAIGRELGRFAVMTVISSPVLTTTPDAARQVLCTALQSDRQQMTRFDGAYVYVADGDQAGECKQVLSGTFDGPIGSLLLDQPFSAPLASGTTIEVSNPLPGTTHLDTKGLNQIADEGLARTIVEARLSFTGDDSRSFSLASYPFIQRDDQIKELRDQVWDGAVIPPQTSPYGFEVGVNGAAATLEPGATYSTGAPFLAVVQVHGDYLIKSGGAWSYPDQPGMADLPENADNPPSAAAPLHWVRIAGTAKGLQYLLEMTDEDDTLSDAARARRMARYTQRLQTYTRAFGSIVRNEFPRQVRRRNTTMLPGLTTINARSGS